MSVLNRTQPIHQRDSRRLEVTLKAFILVIGEARIALPERVASQGEATVLALPLEARLALLRRALPLSEAISAELFL